MNKHHKYQEKTLATINLEVTVYAELKDIQVTHMQELHNLCKQSIEYTTYSPKDHGIFHLVYDVNNAPWYFYFVILVKFYETA